MSKAPLRHTTLKLLSPLDFLLCTIQRDAWGPNRACTLGDLGTERPSNPSFHIASKAGLWPRGRRHTWVWRQGSRVTGLATIRQRTGPKCWEVSHLLLEEGLETHIPDLLESVSRRVAASGGEKVFARLLREDPLVDIARLGGFYPCVAELLYKGPARRDKGAHEVFPETAATHLRTREQVDQFDLFRLYNASTPSEIRHVFAITLDQWRAGQEQYGGRCQEFVLESGNGLRGWLMSGQRSGVGQLAATVHPDNEDSLGPVVDFGLDQLKGTRAVYCLVPEYQVALQRVLTDRGFEPASEYVTLVKKLAVIAKEKAHARATIASG